MDKILILDFGGQYNQLIARRVRSEQVYAEIKSYNKITPEEIKEADYKGIIFTGGPNSVYDETSPHYDSAILDSGIPILGICYGDQLLAYMAGGEITSAENSSEYGKTTLFTADNVLFEGLPSEASDEGFTKISKGLFRYAVEVEMIIMILSNLTDIPEKILKEYRKEAVRNVRRTKGKLNLEELIQRDNFGIAEKNLERPEPQEDPLPDDNWMYEV